MDENMFNVFFREKPTLLLLAVHNAKEEAYASLVAKEIDCTYSHVVKILQHMEQAGLVTFKKTGRLKILRLTSKGEKVASNIEKVRSLL